nr:uncharacterized protein LOC129388045 [Dermacentor andersoni]
MEFPASIIILAAMLYFADPGSTCKTTLPPNGPRLMKAKAVFGDIMRTCKKEILEYTKTVPPQKVHQVLAIVCSMYNACLPLAEEQNLKPVFDCGLSMMMNKSSTLYTKLDLPIEYTYAGEKALGAHVLKEPHTVKTPLAVEGKKPLQIT